MSVAREQTSDSCLETPHRNGTITSRHQMMGAALMHPRLETSCKPIMGRRRAVGMGCRQRHRGL
jgi:hypothetical protein